MTSDFRAAVLHEIGAPLAIEKIKGAPVGPNDVRVRIRATSLCHTDLEVIDGSLRYPLPMVLGHEASGEIAEVGRDVTGVRVGDHVVLSWNPHCGHCFQCDRDQPILCDTYIEAGPRGMHFDGTSKASFPSGSPLAHLMFLGTFAEYCVVPAQQAIVVPKEIPFDRSCLIGCGVMTGVGGALNVADIRQGDTVMVFGCGAVGLAAVQGAKLAGAGTIIAVDLDEAKLGIAARLGADKCVNATRDDPVDIARASTGGRGADVVLESAGHPVAFRQTTEAVRLGGQVIWLGKIDVAKDVNFRWGSLMGEKHLRRSSYGGARPRRDFPLLAKAYLDGRLKLDDLITHRMKLESINEGFNLLRAGKTIRTVIEF